MLQLESKPETIEPGRGLVTPGNRPGERDDASLSASKIIRAAETPRLPINCSAAMAVALWRVSGLPAAARTAMSSAGSTGPLFFELISPAGRAHSHHV